MQVSQLPGGYTLGELVFEDLSPDQQTAFVDLFNLTSAEREPRHSTFDKEELIQILNFPGEVRQRFLVKDHFGTPVAHANAAYADDGSNPDRLRVAISVHPDHRRQGLGSALLTAVTDVAIQNDRTKLASFVFDSVPAGNHFLEAVGGIRTVEHQSNILPLAELSWELMHQWVDGGPTRAPGYSVEVFEGQYPEAILDQMAHLYVVLERDMPTAEDHEPRNWTAAQVTDFINSFIELGDLITAVAFLDEPREAVGMSQLFRRSADPKTWVVTTTMVDPHHRGLALGKWVKGAANLAALERWPGGEYEETGNAETNDAMLAINRAMGFRTELTMSEVEASVASAEAYLSART